MPDSRQGHQEQTQEGAARKRPATHRIAFQRAGVHAAHVHPAHVQAAGVQGVTANQPPSIEATEAGAAPANHGKNSAPRSGRIRERLPRQGNGTPLCGQRCRRVQQRRVFEVRSRKEHHGENQHRSTRSQAAANGRADQARRQRRSRR